MKKQKKLEDYLPTKPDQKLLQVWIDRSLWDAANEWRKFENESRDKNKITWQDLITAMLKRYVDEMGKK